MFAQESGWMVLGIFAQFLQLFLKFQIMSKFEIKNNVAIYHYTSKAFLENIKQSVERKSFAFLFCSPTISIKYYSVWVETTIFKKESIITNHSWSLCLNYFK